MCLGASNIAHNNDLARPIMVRLRPIHAVALLVGWVVLFLFVAATKRSPHGLDAESASIETLRAELMQCQADAEAFVSQDQPCGKTQAVQTKPHSGSFEDVDAEVFRQLAQCQAGIRNVPRCKGSSIWNDPSWREAVAEVVPKLPGNPENVFFNSCTETEYSSARRPLCTAPYGAADRNPLLTPGHLSEMHHFSYGRPWLLGRDLFRHLLDRGMQRHEKVLDYGFGTLRLSRSCLASAFLLFSHRNGLWIMDYLDTGNYHGIEYDTDSYRAGLYYEVPLNGMQDKEPHLYNNVDGEPHVDQFGGSATVMRADPPMCAFHASALSLMPVEFDRILAFAVLIHLDHGLKDRVLRQFHKHLKPGGILHLSHNLPHSKDNMLSKFGFELVQHDEQPSKYIDTKFAADCYAQARVPVIYLKQHLFQVDWFELKRVDH
eukprot:gene8746-221_t